MNDTHVKRLAVLIALVLAFLTGAFYLMARPVPPAPVPPAPPAEPGATPSPAQAASTTSTEPKITWFQNQIEVTLSSGQGASEDLNFTSSLALQNVILEAVPEIAGFLTIQPSTFASVSANQAQPVHVSFSIPAGTTLGTYSGTVHLRVGSTTLPQTLKVVVNVWQKFADPGGRFTFNYPPGWTLSAETGDSLQLYSPDSESSLNAGDNVTPADIALVILAKDVSSSLSDFVKSYRLGWYFAYTQVGRLTVDGHEGLIADDKAAPLRSNPILAVFISSGPSQVLQITGEEGARREFQMLLDTIKLPQGEE